MTSGDDAAWAAYLAAFHARSPGITEQLLSRCGAAGKTPYDWLLAAVPPEGEAPRVLDLACGSAPLWPRLGHRRWLGVDTSAAELAVAAARGARPLARAGAGALPLPDSSVDAVVVAMALMLFQPLEGALAEVARVLRPGGVMAAIVPDTRPLRPRDARVLVPVLTRLRTRIGQPGDRTLADAGPLLRRAGMQLVSDVRRRYPFPVPDAAAGRLWVDALYLPRTPPARIEAAGAALARRAPTEAPVPVRRLVAVRDRAPR